MNVQPIEAASLAELQQYIEQLKAQIAELQAKLKLAQQQQSGEWCHTFSRNLKIGDTGEDVIALQTALKKQGFAGTDKDGSGRFSEFTASAVVGFQEKYSNEVLAQYGLKHGTGFVGTTTRAKLNQLYGCGTSIIPPEPPAPPIIDILPEPPVQPDARCSDTDGGINKYVKGTACRQVYVNPSDSSDTGAFCKTDECVASPSSSSPLKGNIKNSFTKNYVQEYYCKNGKIFSKTIYCENGCLNGACKAMEDAITCDSKCQAKGYDSGICRMSCDESQGETSIGYLSSCNPPCAPGSACPAVMYDCCCGNKEEEEEEECAQEGESVPVVPGARQCCDDLSKISCDEPDSNGNCSAHCIGASICAHCGNGVCGLGENKCNCPEDCDEAEEEQTDLEKINKSIKDNGVNWVAGETSVSNLSIEEKKNLLGLNLDFNMDRSAPIHIDVTTNDKFDWRNVDGQNWMTPVKRQRCADCWIFGAIGAFEAQINIDAGNPEIDFNASEQDILSCYSQGWGCQGGLPSGALKYIKNNGVTSESCMPYKGSDDIPCDSSCVDKNNSKWTLWDYVIPESHTTEVYKEILKNNGPMVVVVNVSEDFFYYKGGVYEPVWTSEKFKWADHCVTLVGYNDEEECWIIKNSWGTYWGEDGYGRVKYGNIEQYKYAFYIKDTSVVYDKPYCGAVGSDNEGWYDNTGNLIKLDNCQGCLADCDSIGLRSEGWYSSCDGELIKYDNCADSSSQSHKTDVQKKQLASIAEAMKRLMERINKME